MTSPPRKLYLSGVPGPRRQPNPLKQVSRQSIAEEQGKRIRETRLAAGATLDHLAEVTGLTKQYLSRIELGQVASNDSEVLAMIARAMRVSPAWLAYGLPPLPDAERRR